MRSRRIPARIPGFGGRALTRTLALASCLGLVVSASDALAEHNRPKRATKYETDLVTAYEACTTFTESIGNIDACPAVRSNDTCVIPPADPR